VNRETRGGTLVIYANPIWPKVQTLAMSFSGLTAAEAAALLTFLKAHLGQQVGLVDYERRYWKGIILPVNNPVVQDGKASFSASFEFQGELDTLWLPL